MPAPVIRPRVALIHATPEAVAPIRQAFADRWPEANCYDLLDQSLATDLAAGGLTPAIVERFRTLGRYAASSGPHGHRTDAILFTCSAFGPAIEAVKRDLSIPVCSPNEAAFARALATGKKIGLIATFTPALPPLLHELTAMAPAGTVIKSALAEAAFAALRRNDLDEHDRLIAATVKSLGPLDVTILGQFSMARAAAAVARECGGTVITTPETAVENLRARFTA